jgi:hypothetical protein
MAAGESFIARGKRNRLGQVYAVNEEPNLTTETRRRGERRKKNGERKIKSPAQQEELRSVT